MPFDEAQDELRKGRSVRLLGQVQDPLDKRLDPMQLAVGRGLGEDQVRHPPGTVETGEGIDGRLGQAVLVHARPEEQNVGSIAARGRLRSLIGGHESGAPLAASPLGGSRLRRGYRP